jgi:AhpD family alkylhydroperoxidase
MQARLKNPALMHPQVLQAMLAADKATNGLDFATRKLVHLRASQINGCGVCVDMHARELKKAGVTDDRIFAVGDWRETPYSAMPSGPRWRSPKR